MDEIFKTFLRIDRSCSISHRGEEEKQVATLLDRFQKGSKDRKARFYISVLQVFESMFDSSKTDLRTFLTAIF